MQTTTIPHTRKAFRDMVRSAGGRAVVVMDRDRPLAAVIPAGGADVDSLALSTSPKLLAILKKSYAQLDRGERLSFEEMENELGLKRGKTNGRRGRAHRPGT
jgi:PHD/YefM family antitoxin component YafN of YafNO toxin-antitoxin module